MKNNFKQPEKNENFIFLTYPTYIWIYDWGKNTKDKDNK